MAELLALKKKSIFVPLKIAQKNEQYHNAMAAKTALGSVVVEEDQFKTRPLAELFKELKQPTTATEIESFKSDAVEIICSEILPTVP